MRLSEHTAGMSPRAKGRGNSLPVVDTATEAVRHDLSSDKGRRALPPVVESEGGEHAAVVGCNANNGNAGRTLNANNAATNRNSNYAGAFANTNRIQQGKGTPTPRPARSNTESEDCAANGGHGQRDYDFTRLPYWDGCCKDKAESDATPASNREYDDATVWQELDMANERRNLKALGKFYSSMTIAVYAVRRCCESRDTERKREYYARAETVARWMIREITNGTYHVRGYSKIDIPPHFPSGKHRTAKVFTLYDRCVQTFVLTIIERKLRRKVLRNNYSNIEGRGIYCNDRRYCMADRIRTAAWKHPDDYVLLTDISKFYDNVSWKVMCGVVFETVKDTTTRRLIAETMRAAGTLPIGSCLSPLFADILMNDYDMTVLRRFKPHSFAAFGDNRCIMCDHATAVALLRFTISYYEGRYGVSLKGDWQIKPVSAGFSFCRKQFHRTFVRERAEIRRRAVRVAHDQQRFAGYKGMFIKTDSHHLLTMLTYHLKSMKNRNGMEIPPFAGEPTDFNEFVDKRVCVTNYRRVENHKESGYYYIFQIVEKTATGAMKLCKSQNGSFEVKQAGDLWTRSHTSPPIYVTVRKDGRSFFFEEYHTTKQEACDAIVSTLGIQL